MYHKSSDDAHRASPLADCRSATFLQGVNRLRQVLQLSNIHQHRNDKIVVGFNSDVQPSATTAPNARPRRILGQRFVPPSIHEAKGSAAPSRPNGLPTLQMLHHYTLDDLQMFKPNKDDAGFKQIQVKARNRANP